MKLSKRICRRIVYLDIQPELGNLDEWNNLRTLMEDIIQSMFGITNSLIVDEPNRLISIAMGVHDETG